MTRSARIRFVRAEKKHNQRMEAKEQAIRDRQRAATVHNTPYSIDEFIEDISD